MRQRLFTHWAIATLAVATLATGCASSGGGDEAAVEETSFTEAAPAPSDDSTREAPTGLEPVYFDFDSAAIKNDQRPTLQANSAAIGKHSEWKTVVIEGNTDERGTEEYNLALGERRANSVKQYLIDSGIPASRLDTVSFGESKPAVQGHDESAWKWNRRDEFSAIR